MVPNRHLVIGGHLINDDSDCYVIAEIGNNHQGSLEVCKEMFLAAKNAGVNAVKLQKRDNKTLLTAEAYNKDYDNRNSFGATYGEHREYLEFGWHEYVDAYYLTLHSQRDRVADAAAFYIPTFPPAPEECVVSLPLLAPTPSLAVALSRRTADLGSDGGFNSGPPPRRGRSVTCSGGRARGPARRADRRRHGSIRSDSRAAECVPRPAVPRHALSKRLSTSCLLKAPRRQPLGRSTP